jgi:hypothetical protein
VGLASLTFLSENNCRAFVDSIYRPNKDTR